MSMAETTPKRSTVPVWRGDNIRAIAAMFWVIAGCALILTLLSGPIVGAAAHLLDSIHPALGSRVGIPVAVLILACAGLALFRRPFRWGRQRSGLMLLAFPSGVLAVLALLVIASFTGTIAPLPPVRAVAAPSLLLLGTFVVLVQVFGEEILLRGLLQPLLTRAWGGWLGILITAFAFTLIHVLGGWRDAVSLLNITLAGIWFGLLALRTSGLLAPTLAHFGYNWGEEMLIGTSPNPGIGDFGSVFDFDLAGPAILGESVDGFNASLVLSMVLVLLILPLALMRGRVPGAVPAQSEAIGA